MELSQPTTGVSQPVTTTRALPVTRILLISLSLAAVLLLGGWLRFTGLDWADGMLLHPDEYFVSDVTSRISLPATLTEYFDTLRSPLNPNNVGKTFYVYGTLPIFVTRWVAQQSDTFSLFDMLPLGRQLSALADWLIVPLVFLIGWRLFDWRIGLLGALLYAAAGLPIQQSHFYTVDTFASLFTTAAFFFAVRVLESKFPLIDAALFGVMLGMGMASKITAAVMAMILIIALLIRWAREDRQHQESAPIELDANDQPIQRRSWMPMIRAAVALIIAGALTVAAFRVFQPYAFLAPNTPLPVDDGGLSPTLNTLTAMLNPIGMRPNPLWITTMQDAGHQGSGKWDAPPNYQWATRPKLLFPLHNIIAMGLGWPLGVIAWLAVLWAIWEIVRRHPKHERLILPVAWVLLIFLWQGTRWVMTMRYFLPIYPQLVLLAAWMPITIWDRVQALIAERGVDHHPASWIGAGIGALAAVSGVLWGIAVHSIYVRPITRTEASHWIAENVPSDVAFVINTPDGERRYEYGMWNSWTAPGQPYDQVGYTQLQPDETQGFAVSFPYSGTLTTIRLNHVASLQPGARSIHVTLYDSADPATAIADGEIQGDFYADGEPYGASYELTIPPVEIDATHSYLFSLTPNAGDPLILSGATLAHEGGWDWPVPFNFAPYDMWGTQFQGYQLEIINADDAAKVERLQYILDHSDYLTISSNRFYHTINRNPRKWPLTIAYYRALFNGELGYELAAEFTSRPALGPLEFCDDFMEEAWSVYDHPRVFVFRKTDAYTSENTARILGSVDLATVQNISTLEVRDRPVKLNPPNTCGFLNWR